MERSIDSNSAQQPRDAVKSFGLLAYIRATGAGRAEFPAQLEKHRLHGNHIPRSVGNALRLAALLELRAARIFTRMAIRFNEVTPVRGFFEAMQREGEEQARIITLCLYTVDCTLPLKPVPSIRDPEIRRLTRELRACERGVWRLSLDEALELTERLKASEISLIFDPLLQQVRNPDNEFCIARLAKRRRSARNLTQRINSLRMEIADLD